MNQKFLRKLIEVEIRLGFINIPKHAIDLFPSEKTKIQVFINEQEQILSYDPKNRRIYGLTSWYKQNKLKPQDLRHTIFLKNIKINYY